MRISSFRANNQYIQWAFLDIFNIIGEFASLEKTVWRPWVSWVSPGFQYGVPVILPQSMVAPDFPVVIHPTRPINSTLLIMKMLLLIIVLDPVQVGARVKLSRKHVNDFLRII